MTPRAARLPRAHPVTLGRKVPPASGEYHWVYLWGWPLRAMHWIAAGCIVVLAATGLYIGRPAFLATGEGVRSGFFMGWIRFIHFAAAGTLVATAVVRLYWLVAGNRFERFRALFPIRRRDWVNLVRQVKYYLLIHPERAPHYLGHNPLQQFSYTGVYLVAACQAATGFALYGQAAPGGFWYSLTEPLVLAAGGIQVVRVVHHLLTWVFLVFIPIHVYLSLRADLLERGGTVSSIITGGRFVSVDETFVDD
jgi:Ni/Fe-hydrogenase b-type cytochrome subunit